MTRDPHGRRLAEWADLVGGSVPEWVEDGEDAADDRRRDTV